jgi:hypothetical protein
MDDLVAFEMNLLRDFAELDRPYSFAARRRLERYEAHGIGKREMRLIRIFER